MEVLRLNSTKFLIILISTATVVISILLFNQQQNLNFSQFEALSKVQADKITQDLKDYILVSSQREISNSGFGGIEYLEILTSKKQVSKQQYT